MPVIDPVSLEDCIDFINKNRDDIREGTYDVKIRAEWLKVLPAEMVHFLLGHCVATKKVVGLVLKGKGAGEAILAQLARDENQEVRQCVASNPYTTAAILESMADDYFEDVRLALARNPGVPDQLLNQMSQDKSTYIRLAVVQNPRTPLKLMNRLASDRAKVVADGVVQLAVSTKSIELLGMLAKCAQPLVRCAVCGNRLVSIEMLDVLCRDENSAVQEAARKRLLVFAESSTTAPEVLSQFAVLKSIEILVALAANPVTPVDVLEKLVKHPDERVRLALVKNRNLSEPMMLALADDKVTLVRVALAARSDISWSVCERLVAGDSESVSEQLGLNPIERERRKMNYLCLDCGKKLTNMGKTFGAKCFTCMGKKIITR